MSYIIEVRNLNHIYGKNTPFERNAIKDINMNISEGEFIGLIGHTGSGKSTLIQHLNGLLQPSSGEILYEGKNIWGKDYPRKNVRFNVGLVFQYPEYQLFEESVMKDIAFGPSNMGLSQSDISERIRYAINFVGIDTNILTKSPFELSGGQKRRVAIAGIIAMKPKVLILDEPTAGLDPVSRDNILGQIKNYQRQTGATVIIVTHSMEDIACYADRIIVMNDSEILLDGDTRDVFSHSTLLKESGLDVPQITQVFLELNKRGINIDSTVYTVEQALEAISVYKATLRG